jgi:LysM repeat protein
VKSGDTVTKIALRNGSKVEWILKANNLSSPAALKADVDIFVPQPQTKGRRSPYSTASWPPLLRNPSVAVSVPSSAAA